MFLELIGAIIGAVLMAIYASYRKVDDDNEVNINMTELDKLLDLNKPLAKRDQKISDDKQGIN